jgi:hypothetical protein
MALRKHYTCDLCGSPITDKDGIGIFHKANGDIQAVYLHRDGVGHHLCNTYIKGLRAMFADLDRIGKIHAELDAAELDQGGE